MLRKLRIFGMLLGAAAFGLLPVTTQASMTPPQTISIGPTDTDFGPGTAPNDPDVFSQFNPSLGTLTSVSLAVSFDFTHTSTITFFTPGTIGTSADQNTITVERPDGTSITSATAVNDSQSTTFNPATMTLNTPITLTPMTTSGSIGPISLTSLSDLSLFTGRGTISLPVVASSLAALPSNNGNGAASVTTQADARVTITYNYTAVPEPSSVVLLGLGSCGLLWARRRLRRA